MLLIVFSCCVCVVLISGELVRVCLVMLFRVVLVLGEKGIIVE